MLKVDLAPIGLKLLVAGSLSLVDGEFRASMDDRLRMAVRSRVRVSVGVDFEQKY
jgi:hypothetical protein